MRSFRFLLLVAVLGGGYYFLKNYEIDGWGDLKVVPRGAASHANGELPIKRDDDVIRIASFNIKTFGPEKLGNQDVMAALTQVVRHFDIVAIQEIRSQRDDILPRFLDLINEDGSHYDFVISQRLGRTKSTEQYAFIYDRASVEVDLNQMYVVRDPDNMLHRPPFYASFRVRGPDIKDAFTFTLVNVHTDPDEVKTELDALDNVFLKIRDDARHEDDVIMLGDFNVDDQHLQQLGSLPNITWAISNVPTNTKRTKQYDNILWDRRATTEFNGRVGVFDFMREYNLTSEEADRVSDHLPVWAEFSIYEGGRPARVARK